MPRKPSIATEEEVLKFYTKIMRRDVEGEDIKLSDAMNAADKLSRYLRDTRPQSDDKETGVVILPAAE